MLVKILVLLVKINYTFSIIFPDAANILNSLCQVYYSDQVGYCAFLSNCSIAEIAIGKYHLNPGLCIYDEDTIRDPIVCCPWKLFDFNRPRFKPISDVASRSASFIDGPEDIAQRRCEDFYYGGTNVQSMNNEVREFPQMAEIGWLVNENCIEFQCGAVIIDDWYLLGSAQCALHWNTIFQNFTSIARVGGLSLKDTDFNEKSDIIIHDVLIHPEYDYQNHRNDIAIYKLKDPVSMISKIIPACLWTDKTEPEDESSSDNTFVIGYGKREQTYSITQKIVSRDKCTFIMNGKNVGPIGDLQICTENSYPECFESLEGPLVFIQNIKNFSVPYILGIETLKQSCTGPTVSTRISSFMEWIIENVWP